MRLPRPLALIALALCLGQVALANVVIATTNLPNGTVGTPYSATIVAKNGCTPYSWTHGGTLPLGLTGNPSSTTTSWIISGTPTAAATYSFNVTVTGCGHHTSTVPYTVVISPAVQSVGVSISPTSATVNVGGTQQFTASISGTSNTAVTWTTTGGTVSSSGLYTAPASAGSYTVTATSQADTTKSASATVTVQAVQSVSVTVSPAGASIYVGGTQQFSATVTGSTNTAVTWNASGGTVSTSGLYTAPSTSGSYTVTATSQADTTKSASALVTVNPTVQHSVSLTWSESSPYDSFQVLRSTSATTGFVQIGTSLTTSYVDNTVVSGKTYYYYATAVSSGQVSGYSNQATAVIPFP